MLSLTEQRDARLIALEIKMQVLLTQLVIANPNGASALMRQMHHQADMLMDRLDGRENIALIEAVRSIIEETFSRLDPSAPKHAR